MTPVPEWPDDAAVRALAAMWDPVGVLSVYVDVDPAQSGARAPSAIEIKNGIEEILDRLRANAPREHWIAVREVVSDLAPELDRMVRGTGTGRGRVLLMPVSEPAEAWRTQMQLPVTTSLVLDRRPQLMPLLAARERGRPVGVVAVSRAEVRLHDHRMGVLTHLDVLEFESATEEWREMTGPAAANPTMARQTVSQRDRFERRVGERRRQFLVAAAEQVAAVAGDRGWEAILLVGDPRLAGILVEPVQASAGVPIAVEDALLEGPVEAPLGDLVDRLLRERQAEAVQGVRDDSAADRSVTGVADVLAALHEGRVAHLVLADGLRLEGVRDPEGVLRAPGAVPAGGEPEPQLAERMIEMALAGSAEVTVVRPDLADPLAEGEGVAALLRW